MATLASLEKALGRKLGEGQKPDITLDEMGLFVEESELAEWSANIYFKLSSQSMNEQDGTYELAKLHTMAIQLVNDSWKD